MAAFITGVDLGGRPAEEDEESLYESVQSPLYALDNQHSESRMEYKQLLDVVNSFDSTDTGDPLDELRRLIRKTRTKMDSQKKVLDGFTSDVHQMRACDRSFSCSDLAALSASSASPSRQRPQLLCSPPQRRVAALGAAPTAASALTGRWSGTAASAGALALSKQSSSSSMAAQARGSSGPLSPQLHVASTDSSGREAFRAAQPAVDERGVVMRSMSGGLASGSRSQPSLGGRAGAVGLPHSLRAELDTLKMPARRAPPGSLGQRAEFDTASRTPARRPPPPEALGQRQQQACRPAGTTRARARALAAATALVDGPIRRADQSL